MRLFILVLPLLGFFLNGCVYFNTFYNARKAYDQATRMHEKRMEKNPEDSILASPEEKIKLERSIAKSSKVLELYPEKKKYQPKALFLIGESYLALGEYSKAILKYEELARFYPEAEENPTARFHRAKCLFLNGQYLAARPALEEIMNNSAHPEFRVEAMTYMAKLELQNNSPAAALELYEKLLQDQARTPEARATGHFEAAKLAFDLKLWERSRGHAKNENIKHLPTKLRYRCDMLAAECLYRLGKIAEGINELETLKKNRLYFTSIPEIDIKLALGYFLLKNNAKALELLAGVPKLAPRTAFSAEAFYRLGEYQLRDLKDEKQAKVYFDSAAASGQLFEYGALAAERSSALSRLAELRKPATDSTVKESHYRDFMIAELFLFRLETVDSALGHLDRIVADPRQDSNHSMRAAYARAFIHDEFKQSKPVSDSLYKYVLEKYPNTDYAKQAERNLGLTPTVKTEEDNAHQLFLTAETARFGGGDLRGSVIPAYGKVIADFPRTREAAKAQFVIAMLYEQLANGEEKVAGSLDSAISAYQSLRERYAGTPYGTVAESKLSVAGISPRAKVQPPQATPAASSPSPTTGSGPAKAGATPTGSIPATGTSPATPGSSTPLPGATSPPNQTQRHDRGRYPDSGRPVMPEGTAPAPDTSISQPGDNNKEVLDDEYENVDQY